ncbi:hypothetical protein [Nocardiopsis sp. NPDC055824]
MTNVFYGMVNAQNGTFGAAGEPGEPDSPRPSVTGPMRDHEISEAVRAFATPEGYTAAAELLADRAVLVLTGEAGTGKRTGAISLLSRLSDGGITVLPPSQTLESLADRDFVSGRGYIVLDWFGVDRWDSPAEHEYQWSVLFGCVANAGAHLVLTCDRGVPTGRTAPSVPWTRPRVVDVLHEHLRARAPGEEGTDPGGDPGVPEAAEKAAAALPDDRSLADVVAVAEGIAAGEDPQAAVEGVLRSSSRTRVQEWFDADPERRDVADATALALLHGVHERDYEILAKRLHHRLNRAFPSTAPLEGSSGRTAEGDTEKEPDRLPMLRRRRGAGGHSLIRVRLRDDGWLVRRFPGFAENGDRAEVLRQLWERYDADFWNAVESWTRTVVGHETRRVFLARGLAALAGIAFEEVHDLYLDRWSRRGDGDGRDTCVFVLWSMCMDEGLAPVVLRTADRWLSHGTPAQAETALHVWSGELGVAYPTEAFNRLWSRMLEEDAAERRLGAAQSIGTLFGSLVDRGGNGRAVLRRLDDGLLDIRRFGSDRINRTLLIIAVFSALTVPTSEPVTGGPPPAHEDDGPDDTGTGEALDGDGRSPAEPGDGPDGTAGPLAAEDGQGREALGADPAIARHLMLAPDQIPTVACLWVETVRHRPVRRLSIEALWRTLRALQRNGADAQGTARDLLLALVPMLRPDERTGFRTSFVSAVRRCAGSDPSTDAVLEILAGVFGDGTDTPTGAGAGPGPDPLTKVTTT